MVNSNSESIFIAWMPNNSIRTQKSMCAWMCEIDATEKKQNQDTHTIRQWPCAHNIHASIIMRWHPTYDIAKHRRVRHLFRVLIATCYRLQQCNPLLLLGIARCHEIETSAQQDINRANNKPCLISCLINPHFQIAAQSASSPKQKRSDNLSLHLQARCLIHPTVSEH